MYSVQYAGQWDVAVFAGSWLLRGEAPYDGTPLAVGDIIYRGPPLGEGELAALSRTIRAATNVGLLKVRFRKVLAPLSLFSSMDELMASMAGGLDGVVVLGDEQVPDFLNAVHVEPREGRPFLFLADGCSAVPRGAFGVVLRAETGREVRLCLPRLGRAVEVFVYADLETAGRYIGEVDGVVLERLVGEAALTQLDLDVDVSRCRRCQVDYLSLSSRPQRCPNCGARLVPLLRTRRPRTPMEYKHVFLTYAARMDLTRGIGVRAV